MKDQVTEYELFEAWVLTGLLRRVQNFMTHPVACQFCVSPPIIATTKMCYEENLSVSNTIAILEKMV
jgi:hypothetical protein